MKKYFSLMGAVLCSSAVFAMSIVLPPANPTKIIPVPKKVSLLKGQFKIRPSTTITFSDNKLLPLAKIVSDNIYLATGQRLQYKLAQPNLANIVLEFDQKRAGESYFISVSDKIIVQAQNYNALAAATASLIQSIDYSADGSSIPCMKITDYPDSDYRGMMLDLARYYHSMDILEQAIKICNLYKIKYLHLHLTDRGRFVFPSTAYPQLTSKKNAYSLDEFNHLESFAKHNCFTIIPELDIPSHADAFVLGMPEVFKCDDGIPYTLNFAKPKALEVIETLVGEVCQVFKSSPYYHMGGDEIILPNPETNPDFKKAIEKNNLRDCMDLYRLLIVKMNQIAKKNGKQLIVWERFLNDPKSPVQIPKDVIVNEYAGHWFPADEIMAAGYSIINASGNPLYVVQKHKYPLNQLYDWSIYNWECFSPPHNPRHYYKVPANPLVIGGQICSWEQPQHLIIPSLRKRAAVLAERLWNNEAKVTLKEFETRLEHTDKVLNTQINPVMPSVAGLIPEEADYQRDYPREFSNSVVLTMQPRIPGKIYYTLNKKSPTTKSKRYLAPLTFDKNIVDFKAQMFDEDAKPIGYTYDQQFALSVLTVESSGVLPGIIRPTIGKLPNAFSNTVIFTVTASRGSGSIHYTINGRKPSLKSPKTSPKNNLLSAKIEIDKSCTVRIQYFDEKGRARGQEWHQIYNKIPYNQNLATGKVTKTSGQHQSGGGGENAVDGWVILDKHWGNGPYPQWWQVDLDKICDLTELQLVFYFDGKRYYQYTIAASLDGENWTKIIDQSKNTKTATEQGVSHHLKNIKARYIRVNMLKNSANSGVHIVEFRAFDK